MRTRVLKINGEKRTGVLLAGGPGFKIYHVDEVSGWVLSLGSAIHIVEKGTQEYITVCQYLNLNYSPIDEQERIKATFDWLVKCYSKTEGEKNE
jgi:hypothetical protein